MSSTELASRPGRTSRVRIDVIVGVGLLAIATMGHLAWAAGESVLVALAGR